MYKMLRLVLISVFLASSLNVPLSFAGEVDILINKLVEKGILTPAEALALKTEAKEEAAKEMAKGEALTAPAWTQKIKLSGDVKYRTQFDWNKGTSPSHYRVRQRARARVGIEGKVNDQVSGGVYAVTGNNDPRSTAQTLENNFETEDLRLDGYWIEWWPKISSETGKADVLLGKFKNKLRQTELMWDTDIWPAGTFANYTTPTFDFANTSADFFANTAILWIDEIATEQRDPMLYVIQGGMDIDLIKNWDARLGIALAYYDFANYKNNQNSSNVGSSGTNAQNGGALGTSSRFDFNMIDIVIEYDAKRLWEMELIHGVYSDFIANTDPDGENFAFLTGGYIGQKNPSKMGEWKYFAEYRYIERDAVPDILPDSDFPGFTNAGVVAIGGTNGHGLNTGIQYALFDNAVLSAEYYLGLPVETTSTAVNFTDETAHILQLDINVKF